MNVREQSAADDELHKLFAKNDPNSPALQVTGPTSIAIKAGTVFAGHKFTADLTPIVLPDMPVPGTDYAVVLDGGRSIAVTIDNPLADERVLGGFHFGPGGLATARSGGDTTPAIHRHTLWDRKFRPAAPRAGGMCFADIPGVGRGWYDIYLLGRDHLLNGTSAFNVEIAHGRKPPMRPNPEGGYYSKLDYPTAIEVYAHHGKQLLSFAEFSFLAKGVTERTALGHCPKLTAVDAPRTSAFLYQPTGNYWQWGHDGDEPDFWRPSLFGGSGLYGDVAGSRYAILAYWPGHSGDDLGARGRCDHLQLD